jgi:ABC-2 type transport system ATP-binding protein
VRDVVLNAQGIAKSYGQVQALDGLTFEVRAGEILGLLGPNGAGKTTAIRVLTTIFPASRGHFTVMDIPDSRPEAIRALIGVLPESNGFPTGMTGGDFLTYMGRLYGQSKARAETKVTELLSLLGLENARQARISTYSRGMKQRLMVARSLVNDPKLLFLDEPTLGLDPKGQQEMLQRIREAAEVKRVAVILSSHSLDVVEAISHRVLILSRGRVIAQGSVAEITRRVAAPHTCRIQFPAEAVAKALSVLSAMAGVTVERHANRQDELIVSFRGTRDDRDINAVLERLVQAGVPIQAFSRESVRLSDAFLSMIGEAQA